MRVYRIEYPDGYGPYQQGTDLAYNLCCAHSDSAHPVAALGSHPYAVCAFRSMRDLFRWFGGWLRTIIRDGGHIAIYDISEDKVIYRDAFQLAFERKM